MSNATPLLPWRDRLLARHRASGRRGFRRLLSLLKPDPARRSILARTRYGSVFRLAPDDVIDTHVLVEGFYESEVLEALLPALSAPDAVLWVVGANFGLHAVTAATLRPDLRVVAFEPSPAMGARVIENASLNAARIDLHAYALSAHEGVFPFHANASGNPGMSSLHRWAGGTFDHCFHVAAMTAAAVIDGGIAPAPTALIVDAEGAEEEVLRGFGARLADTSLRLVVVEADERLLESPARAPIRALLEDAGFVLERLVRRENTAHALANFRARR